MKKPKNSIPFSWEKRNSGKLITRQGLKVQNLRMSNIRAPYLMSGVVCHEDGMTENEMWTPSGFYYAAPGLDHLYDLFIIVPAHVRMWNRLTSFFK